MLHASSLVFRSGFEVEYILQKTIKETKQQYKEKLEGYYSTADARCMWQDLQQIMDYKGTIISYLNSLNSIPASRPPTVKQRGGSHTQNMQEPPISDSNVSSADVSCTGHSSDIL